MRSAHETTLKRFLEQLVGPLDYPASLLSGPVALLDLFAGACGAALCVEGRIVLIGATPPEEVVRRTAVWLPADEVWATDRLADHLPDMIAHRASSSGLLTISLPSGAQDRLIWFRPDQPGVETGRSRPWPTWKLNLAGWLRYAIGLVLASQLATLRTLNEKLEQANNAKSRFLAQMSHELRTPLNAVIGFSELLTLGVAGPTTDRQQDYLKDILSASNHLLSLITDILEYSKLEAGRYQAYPASIDATAAGKAAIALLRPQAAQQGIELRCAAPDSAPIVADERAVNQILLNLLSNAIKFTAKGGVVTLAIEFEAAMAVFRVIDTGVGIAPEDMTELGKPFFQVHSPMALAQGTGLGLSIVKALVEANQGRFEIASAVGAGTTASVYLPRGG